MDEKKIKKIAKKEVRKQLNKHLRDKEYVTQEVMSVKLDHLEKLIDLEKKCDKTFLQKYGFLIKLIVIGLALGGYIGHEWLVFF